jgi:chorismate mutase
VIPVGLLTELLGLPLLPLRGVVAVAEQVRQQAEEEYYDPGRIRAQLEEVERQRAEGSLSDEEAEALEEELVERLIEGQRRFREE